MAKEKAEAEWNRLCTEQEKTRRDEVFGGLSAAERTEYSRKSDRIRELESIIQASAVAEKNARSEKAEQQLQWNRESETDTPQGEAHQPYRSREQDSNKGSSASGRQRGKAKKAPEHNGD